MAYNNNYPIGYQPYYPAYSQNQQSTQTGLIWIQGEAEAKRFPVAPNQTVALWDSESQTIYLKTADSSGMPNVKILDYEIRNNPSNSPEILDKRDFALKEDIDYLKGEINALKAKFDRTSSRTKEKADGK